MSDTTGAEDKLKLSERFSCYARKLCQIGRLIFVGYYRESVFLSIRQEAGNHFGQCRLKRAKAAVLTKTANN